MRRILIIGEKIGYYTLGNGKIIEVGDIILGPTGREAEVLEIGNTCMRVRYVKTGRRKTISNLCITDVEKRK